MRTKIQPVKVQKPSKTKTPTKKTEKAPEKKTRKVSPKKNDAGTGVCAFICSILEANELAKKKKTDEELADLVVAEYPNAKSAQDMAEGKLTMNSHRQKYLNGGFTNGRIPPQVSFRYNAKGQKVNYRTGRIPLAQDEIDKIEKKHKQRLANAKKSDKEAKKTKTVAPPKKRLTLKGRKATK